MTFRHLPSRYVLHTAPSIMHRDGEPGIPVRRPEGSFTSKDAPRGPSYWERALQPEIKLAQAVILEALKDIGKAGNGKPKPHTTEYKEAYLFLTATSGPWADARKHWALIADIDEQKLLDLCRDLDPPGTIRSWTPTSKKAIERAREIETILTKAGIDLMSCKLTDALPVLNDAGYRTARGKKPTTDTVYYARAALR